ncbi:MAG: S-methyl-5-thioribose-1-phosphate isomerase [Pelolinea sp.]|nr:S-methyl-5-thioribose-1-phosphate isomerase [Pelolinea sp.]
MRTLEWESSAQRLKLIDQRALPSQLTYIYLNSFQEAAEAIRNMTVRGAPAIGVTAAFGMILAAIHSKATSIDALRKELVSASQVLNASRPTAVNLPWALKRIMVVAGEEFASIDELRSALLDEAFCMADEDVATNKAISTFGAELIDDGDTIIHHCNTGALATVDWGTALGIIRMAHEQGKRIHVLVDETRPRLQGARLTAWELAQYKIPYDIISDNAAGYFLHKGEVNKVLFGGDRVARNGDVANKIGSYMLALAANANKVPVYSVVPTSTIDLSLANGDLIPIEERDQDEVLDIQIHGQKVTPEGASARNPAFDVTPHHLLTGIITEKGVIYPPFSKNLFKAAAGM